MRPVQHPAFEEELDVFLQSHLAGAGYVGAVTDLVASGVQIVIKTTRTKAVLGEKGRRIRGTQEPVARRFQLPLDGVELFTEKPRRRSSPND